MNAIITAATGYTEEHLHVFLSSLKLHCGGTKLFLIVYEDDCKTIESLRTRYSFIEPIYISRKRRRGVRIFPWLTTILSRYEYLSVNPFLEYIGRFPLDIGLDRYFTALQIVNSNFTNLSKVLITDCRDVIFQRNPFLEINGETLISGLEPGVIEECPYNAKWVKVVYGEREFEKMRDSQIVCAGVTLGSVKKISDYLIQMCSEIWRHLPEVNFSAGFDQAIHNYLIHKMVVAPNLTENKDGLIATLSLESTSNIYTDSANCLINVHGKVPAIVHQYDRHPNLVNFILNCY